MFCPAIIWYQTGYSTSTLRQASRRSWRIGQTKPVTVRFLCYENTAQVGCLRLMGRKLLVSMAVEGKFSESGLHAADDGLDVLTTLTRELVMNQGVGQSADDVWRALQPQQAQPQALADVLAEPQPSAPEPIRDVAPSDVQYLVATSADLDPRPGRETKQPAEQLSLF
jgi:hypothetical protein